MAKKDRPAAAKARKPSRSKDAPAGADLSPQSAPSQRPTPFAKSAKMVKTPPTEPLNNHVTVHIISVPPAQPVPPKRVAPAPAPAPAPANVPSQRSAALPGPGSGAEVPVLSAVPAPRLPTLRPVTPAAGSPTTESGAIDPLAPTPVHRSAKNLTPMEQMLWAARLQKAKDVVASQMKVKITGGKLVRRYTAIDHDDGLFEIQTDKGFYVALLSKTGEFSIYWRHDRKAY